MKAYYARLSDRMITYGPHLGMPFTRAMKDGISRIFFCHRHSPTIETLRKYAQAVGCELVIQLVRSRATLKKKASVRRNRKKVSAQNRNETT